jgi:hypothetical protein
MNKGRKNSLSTKVLNGTPHAKELTQTTDLTTFTRNNTKYVMVGLKCKM